MATTLTIIGSIVVVWLIWPRRKLYAKRIGATYVVVLIKGRERYAYTFIHETRRETLCTIQRQANRPGLSLNRRDALRLEQRIRKICNMPTCFAEHKVQATLKE